jgi:adenylate cyclase
MATGDVKRKLTAIFSADVEGYSRLMGEDELATVETLTSYKETMRKLIRQYRGRVVDSTGDNLLAEFASVVDAVQCAVEVQQVLSAKNEALPENRRMYFRIGINSGDVIEEDERIYGDGVNVAARVESLAEGGGISISGTAYDQLGKKLPLGYEYLGEQTVKNIEKPVRVYRILTEAEAAGKVIGEIRPRPKQMRWAAVGALAVLIIGFGVWAIWNFYLRPPFERASVEKMEYSMPEEPSVAVLPFDNLSGDPKQEYFSDGLSDQIITALSKVPQLFVIARNSTFTYKGKPVKVQEVAEDLGVRYVLEGSFQRTTDRIRVTAQLIDAITGRHVWAERYDRELTDIFKVQDEITMERVKALQVELTVGEKARIMGKGTDNLEAYQKTMLAMKELNRISKDGNILARKLAEEAIDLDPEYATPHRIASWTHFNDARFGWSQSRPKSFKRAVELAQKAVELDDSDAGAYSLLGMLNLSRRQYEKAIAEGERAVSISPNGANYNVFLAAIYNFSGRPEEAIELTKKAMRSSPIYPAWFLYYLGLSYRLTGQYDQAIEALKSSMKRNPEDIRPYTELVIVYSQLDQSEETQALVAEILKKRPSFSLKKYAKSRLYKDPAELKRELAALRKAGLPETPSLPLPDKPSIAVLPFVNMSGDPEQEYFSDGITESIITGLSKTPRLFVIARNSTFTYKGKPTKVQKVGRELGVRYVLEGSVQKSADRIRITAQLVDAKSGNHVWAEQYDRDLKEIFALQDEITMKIIAAMQLKLTEGETARLHAKGTDNLEAYLKWLQANYYFNRWNPDDNVRARKLAEEVIDLDPEYPAAYRLLALTHVHDVLYGSSKDRNESIRQSIKLAQKALSMDDSDPLSHWALGRIYSILRQYEKAIVELNRALNLNPNLVEANSWLGVVLNWAGRSEEALPLIKKARRLSPTRIRFSTALGQTYLMLGRYEEAIGAFKEGIQIKPNNFFNHHLCAISYLALNREEEARAESSEAFRINPNYSVEASESRWPTSGPMSDPVLKARFHDVMREVGFK